MGEGWPSKRKRLTLNLTWFAALAAFGVTLAVVLLYEPEAVTAGDLERLAKGMTFHEVRAILGEPDMSLRSAVVSGDPHAAWTYSLPASHWSVTEADYQLKFYNERLDSWYKLK